MQGHSHALSGACTGLAAGILLHLRVPGEVALGGFTAGTSLLCDLDSCGSSAARCLGFASRILAWVIAAACGGHRHLTHSLPGVALFTTLAWLACHFRHDWGGQAGLVILVGLSVSAGLEALHVTDGHLADLIGLAAAVAVVVYGYGLTLIPLATALGFGTHIAGDLATDSGVRLLYPFSGRKFHLLPEPLAFTTGTRPETRIVDPALYGVLALLVLWVADPGLGHGLYQHAVHLARAFH
jgi:membrane-bound metal-dependent hydrolase YbcI (DUF457 family)